MTEKNWLRSDLVTKAAAVALQLEELFFVHGYCTMMCMTLVYLTENKYALAIVCTFPPPEFSWLYPQNVMIHVNSGKA
jgi:hypothetical protein